MAFSVGVVCEGSHDFLVIGAFLRRLFEEHGQELGRVDCLQPELSASFDQVGGGGWGRVKAWCEDNGGQGYRIYIDKPLFSSSSSYDLLVVHLDGDVIDICNQPPLDGLSSTGLTPAEIVSHLESTMLDSWMDIVPDHRRKVIACIPVHHLEAWLTAALDSAANDVESTPIKDAFRQAFSQKYPGRNRDLYGRAANDAALKLQAIRNLCQSFVAFETRLTQGTV